MYYSRFVSCIYLIIYFIKFADSFRVSVWGTRAVYRGQLKMNMFDRFARVVTSNINNVLKGLEDPEKILDQAVNDMQNDLVKIRQSYAEISATQKRMANQKENADKLAADWYRRAQLALQNNDEMLAREALSRRQAQIEISDNLAKQIAMQSAVTEKLYTSMTTLDTKITEAKRQKDAFIARARTAKTTLQVNEMLSSMLGGSLGSNSMEAFERMKNKVENLETQAEVSGELAATSSGSSLNIEDRFKQLEGNSKVDDELAMMRRQLPQGERDVAGQLPKQKASFQIPDNAKELDLEYERLKRELGK